MYKTQSYTLLAVVTGLVLSLTVSCQNEIVQPISSNKGARQQASDSIYLPDLNVVNEFKSAKGSPKPIKDRGAYPLSVNQTVEDQYLFM